MAELDDVQNAIQNASTGAEAYKIFAKYAGNDNGLVLNSEGTKHWNMEKTQKVDPKSGMKDYKIDTQLFKNKLKHMARQVYDYPELKGHIGNIHQIENSESASEFMSTHPGYTVQNDKPMANLYYNAFKDRQGKGGEKTRAEYQSSFKSIGEYNSDLDHAGNHELGHVQNFLLMDRETYAEDWEHNVTADSMLDKVLQKVLSKSKYAKLKRYKKDKDGNLRGQIHLEKNKLWLNGITSRYGQVNAGEYFAEAFADVYQNGKKAKKASIELVKLYEKLRDEKKKKQSVGNEN